MQLLLKTLLDAQLADVVGTAVLLSLPASSIFFSVWLIRPIAHHGCPARHSCETAAPDVHPWEPEALSREAGHFLVGQPGTNWQGLKILTLSRSSLNRRLSRRMSTVFQCGDGFVQVGDFEGAFPACRPNR
jgi:hypothetical protein